MIVALLATLYILAGGSLAVLLLSGGDRAHPLAGTFPPASGFALILGTIVLWPVLLALAAEGRRR